MIDPIKVESIENIAVYFTRFIGPYNDVGSGFEKIMKWAYANKIKNKKNLLGKNSFTYCIYYDDPNITEVSKLRTDVCISNSDDSFFSK